MRTIEIDNDVYEFLLSKAERIGEDGSSILRRLLGLPNPGSVSNGASSKEQTPSEGNELTGFIQSAEFKRHRNVKDRFLAILGELYRRDPESFEAVTKVEGRKRKYFAKSSREIATSGRSVSPRAIPGSPFWVMTNASTTYKKSILRSAMEVLGYDGAAIRAATKALGG